MSWLSKIFSKTTVEDAEQMAKKILDDMPSAQCLTAQPAMAGAADSAVEDDNPTRQRRYFVKKGLYVENEDDAGRPRPSGGEEEIPDRHPVDLKTLFPKLSLI